MLEHVEKPEVGFMDKMKGITHFRQLFPLQSRQFVGHGITTGVVVIFTHIPLSKVSPKRH